MLTVAPGDSVEFEIIDASGGQIDKQSGVAEVAALDFAKVNPVTGPVYVDGAEPGDALKVTIESFVPSGWGWTAVIPGFGLLADDFPDPAINIWTYDAAGLAPAVYGPGGRVPLKPFCGTIRSEEHTSELQSQAQLVCRLLLEKKKNNSKAERREQQSQETEQRRP